MESTESRPQIFDSRGEFSQPSRATGPASRKADQPAFWEQQLSGPRWLCLQLGGPFLWVPLSEEPYYLGLSSGPARSSGSSHDEVNVLMAFWLNDTARDLKISSNFCYLKS